MLARLGDFLYGMACVLAVLFAVIVSLTAGNDFKPENFIGVIVIWLIAHACRHVLVGR
jgi:phosphotransferase system  glucose/maltose/N-acetylglucosamine-specific IIC component